MTQSWLAYLPPHLASDLLAHPDIAPLDRVLHTESVALFADLSGFTPMSEALGLLGPRGTEELSQILNRTFGAMIRISQRWGGSIAKFAGDALTIVFPFQNETQQITTRRALHCALEMQAVMQSSSAINSRAGAFQLTMKIGIGKGSLLTTTVGDEAIRLEYLLFGGAIDQSTHAEHLAQPGQIVVSNELLLSVAVHADVPVAEGFSVLQQLQNPPQPAPLPPVTPLGLTAQKTIARYLPPAIVERLTQGQSGFIDEHRTITTMFVRFAGFDYQDRAVLARLHPYLRQVVQISEHYGGYLRQVEVGDKGSLFIVLFGAPLSHEDDAERAVLCALDLRTIAQGFGIETNTGITSGRIYCGLVGSNIRREYAAIGDSVNLAARLMSAAQADQILVDTATRQAITTRLQWHDMPPLIVKGKRAPIAVSMLEQRVQRSGTRLRAPGYRLPMVGRQIELSRCRTALDSTQQGQGQILGITGEAGMGKSRLVAELLRSDPTKHLTVFTSECLSYGTASSYLVWQGLLRNLFELTTNLPHETQLAQVHDTLQAIDPELLDRMPLLSTILQLPIPETAFIRSLDGELRKLALHALIITCLRHWARQRPFMLILEDCHWIDSLSDELLLAVGQQLADLPLLLLLTYRPFSSEQPQSADTILSVRSLPRYQECQLLTFTTAETEQLIQLKLAQHFNQHSPVGSALLERIIARAQGNPFYIDELLNFLHDQGIDPQDPAALEGQTLPDSLQRVILSRIDRLHEGPKSTLKLASIIGRLFQASWLWAISPQLGNHRQVQGYLAELRQHDLTQLERSEPEEEYLFKHLITREVAYESLALSTRIQLHEQVGIFIEQTYQANLPHWLDALAYHYGHSGNMAKQREYFQKAAVAAQAAFANAAALHYYAQLLPLLSQNAQGAVLLAMCDIQQHIGQWSSAEQTIQAILNLANQQRDQALLAQGLYRQGGLLRYKGQAEQALTVLEQACAQFTALGDQRALLPALQERGRVKYYHGRYEAALADYQQCLELASHLEDHLQVCEALNTIANIHYEHGNYREAISYYQRALERATEHSIQRIISTVLMNLGHAHFLLGELSQAYGFYQQALELALRIGYSELVALNMVSLGAVYESLAMGTQARACFYASVAAMGETIGVRWFLWIIRDLAALASREAQVEEADALYQRGIALGHAFEQPLNLAYLFHGQARHSMAQHRYAEARESARAALDLAIPLGYREAQYSMQILLIQLQVHEAELTPATAIEQLKPLQEVWDDPAYQAALRYSIWQIDPQLEDNRQDAAERYRSLYAQSSKNEYRQRCQELSGEMLPPPPPLPEPPTIVAQYQTTLDALLRHADYLLAEHAAKADSQL